MINKIPNPVIGAVSEVISEYYSNATLTNIFMECGAPGNVPTENRQNKCREWLMRCNNDSSVNALHVLGRIIKKIMDMEPSDPDSKIAKNQQRIKDALSQCQLSYQNGYVRIAGANAIAKTLIEFIQEGNFPAIEKEFERTISLLDSDPHAAITASSAIIEALCKTYIQTFSLEMPSKQTISPLWKSVQTHLGLSIDSTLEEDQKKIRQGLVSIVDGIGSYRTHIGSAHGRGIQSPEIEIFDARLAVNASHTLVMFIMERWHSSK